jgi:hypothetical protein
MDKPTEPTDPMKPRKYPYCIDDQHTLIWGRYGPVIYCRQDGQYIPVQKGFRLETAAEPIRVEDIRQKAPQIRPLTACMSVRSGPKGTYIYYKPKHKRSPAFVPLSNSPFADPWTTPVEELVQYAYEHLE